MSRKSLAPAIEVDIPALMNQSWEGEAPAEPILERARPREENPSGYGTW